MKSLAKGILVVFFLVAQSVGHADDAPRFLQSLSLDYFFPGGLKRWKLVDGSKNEPNSSLQWKDSSAHEIRLEYRDATTGTIDGILQGMQQEVVSQLNGVGGKIISVGNFIAITEIFDSANVHSINFLYGTADGAYLWKYQIPARDEKARSDYIDSATFAARKHQYETAVKYGNVIMGHWGTPIHEYAKMLVKKKAGNTRQVYRDLLQTNPSDYAAQMEYAAITTDKAEASQCAEIVARDAEDENLLKSAAGLLQAKTPSLSSYPLLSKEDKGLVVVLVPLEPVNPWLLEEVAKKYEGITGIPVVIRRLPTTWDIYEVCFQAAS